MREDHFHAQYELYYLFSGERNYFIRDRTYSVHAGDLVFIPKNELHRTSEASEPAHERMVINFTDDFLMAIGGEFAEWLLRPFRAANPVLKPKAHAATFERLFTEMLDEMRERPEGHEFRLRHLFAEVLLLSARLSGVQQPASVPAGSPGREKMSEIAAYIRQHYAEDLSLGFLAERFHFSPYYLSRTFKSVTGFSLTEYIQSVRVRQAQKLLKETDWSVTDVALRSGFDNFSHFGKVFKRIARLTPRDYRKLAGKENGRGS
nr:AraC family transcriptional regulator [Cohnella sp. CFH 77786]